MNGRIADAIDLLKENKTTLTRHSGKVLKLAIATQEEELQLIMYNPMKMSVQCSAIRKWQTRC